MVASCGAHRAYFRDRVTGGSIGEPLNLVGVRWQRLLDEVSSADVTIALEDCCEIIGDVHPWRHELVVLRDGVEVWSGPVMRTEVTREDALVYAWDQLAWLSRRAVRTEGTLELDVARIAERLIVDGMAPHDDTNLVANLDVRDTGLVETREYRAGTQTVLDALRDLAGGPIDFTALGRRLVIGGDFGFGNIPTFTDDDFAEDLRIVTDGFSLCTAVVTRGRDDEATGRAGGVDPFYGLVECVGQEQESLTSDTGANQAAERLLAGQTVAPRFIQTPQGETLSPDSTQNLDELVPGALARISSTASCVDASGVYKLTGLEVVEEPESGERISISFAPVDSLPDPLRL